jgi:beta-mannosidase
VARPRAIGGETVLALTEGWTLAVTPAGSCPDPAAAAGLPDWIVAPVPGTAATALTAAGVTGPDGGPPALRERDVWYRRPLPVDGCSHLRFEGLATLCEIWIDQQRVLTHEAMFTPREIEVDPPVGATLWLCFRALQPRLSSRGPRARWRPRIIDSQGLRLIRTTLLGRIPSWCPKVDIVGPWRSVSLITRGPLGAPRVSLRARWTDAGARLSVDLTLAADAPPVLSCGGAAEVMRPEGEGRFVADLAVPGAEPWWPHTHGSQPLYPVSVQSGDLSIDLGHTGFRSVRLDRGPDGRDFRLAVNGEAIFCRGACWIAPDPTRLGGTRADYEPTLRLAVEAGMNMVRISGVGVYESPAFFALCDELGLMVWQDFMFANFDYPANAPDFAATVRQEAALFLEGVDASPSLTVLCGGSEVFQQAEMMGLAPGARQTPLYDHILRGAAEQSCPDIPYVANTPEGGALAFVSDAGVSHYYGVGAYERPLEDARRAEVKFTSECLAFSNVPDALTLARDMPGVQPHDPRWKAGVPRDAAASWDFEDVRDHYLRTVFGVDPYRVRRDDPDTYLDLSRLVTGEVMTAVFSEWRRARSPCNGALVWFLRDQQPGAGWGVIDASGEPKAAWHALKRVLQPVQVMITDEGVNGLAVHVINERAAPLTAELRLTVYGDDAAPLIDCRQPLALAARGAMELSAFSMIGRFFDLTHAYRFGPRQHQAVRARIVEDETVVSEAFHFPPSAPWTSRVEVEARTERQGDEWRLILRTDRLLRFVHIADPGFRPDADWAPLVPGEACIVRLVRREGAEGAIPAGEILAPGGRVLGGYRAAED